MEIEIFCHECGKVHRYNATVTINTKSNLSKEKGHYSFKTTNTLEKIELIPVHN